MKLFKRIWLSEWFRVLFILPFPLWCIPIIIIYELDHNLIIALYLLLFYLACKFNN